MILGKRTAHESKKTLSFKQLDDIIGGGLPVGGIIALHAEEGTGKTRFATALMLEVNKHSTVAIVQKEMPPDEYAVGKNPVNPSMFLISNDFSINDMPEIDFLVIDSYTMLGLSSDQEIERFFISLKEKIAHKTCVLIIVQQNSKGDMKGSKSISHLVDMTLIGSKSDGGFTIKVDKNRYGRSGGIIQLVHTDSSVTIKEVTQDKPVISSDTFLIDASSRQILKNELNSMGILVGDTELHDLKSMLYRAARENDSNVLSILKRIDDASTLSELITCCSHYHYFLSKMPGNNIVYAINSIYSKAVQLTNKHNLILQ